MQEVITIVESEVSVDVEKLKKIIIEKWKSGRLYHHYHNQGKREEELFRSILNELTCYADNIFDEITNKIREKSISTNVYIDCLNNYPKTDIRSIGFEVLNLLEGTGWDKPIEELTTDDIPMILEFLDTPPGKSLEAWDKWEKYWANLDYPARRKKLLES